MKRCLKCSSLMPDDAARCIKCGFEATPARATPPARPPQPAVRPATGTPAPVVKTVVKPAPGAQTQGARPGRIRGGLKLAWQSWRVLSLDKQLLVFPLLSGVSCLLVLASFAAGVLASGLALKDADAALEKVNWILLFVYYFANYFVIVFFNSALVACAMIRFQGGQPTVRDGLRAASGCLVQILAWVTLAATVGVLLRFIEQRVDLVGKIAIALLGAAWTIATYFVVPVLVVEKLGPIDTLGRSATLMKETWGESLVSNIGIGLVTFIAMVLVGIVVVPLVMMAGAATGSAAVMIAAALACVALFILMALIGSALHAIILSALYLYAAEDKVPEAFEGAVQQAFATR